jgi:hypothetical protein
MKKILVMYLSTCYTKRLNLINFIKNYRKYNSGVKHKLLICFKNLSEKEKQIRKKLLKKINCELFIDPENKNDHEWGSIKRVASNYKGYYIFFMNDYSYPIKKNWLQIIAKKIKSRTILACTGSNSSFATNSFFRKKKQNLVKFLLNNIYFNLFVPRFPNPHLRANSFLIKAKDYLSFIKNRKINNKRHSLLLESGHNSFSKFFRSKNYKLLVINSDRKLFKEEYWKNSNTFNYGNQEKLLISDKDTRYYQKLDKKSKNKRIISVWGM